MVFLGKSVRFVAITIMVIVAVCLWIGFFWEPAWYVPGVFFGSVLIILIISFFIMFIIEFIDKIKKRPRQQ